MAAMAASSARIVAVANQKGGVAKTTTVVSLGAALAEQGRRVLLVDLDAQACLTFSLGVDPDDVEQGLHEVLRGEAGVGDVLIRVPVDAEHHLDLVPATIDLAAAETELAGREHRELVLREALAPLRRRYDVMLLDCSPSLGILTMNVLTAAHGVIMPIQCEYYALEGLSVM